MHINASAIKNQVYAIWNTVIEEGGKLANRTVKVLKPYLDYVRSDKRAAGASVVIANIIFFEIALRVANLAEILFTRLFGEEEHLSQTGKGIKGIFMVVLLTSLIAGMNAGLSKGLKLPLSPLMTAAISASSCVSYICFRLWWASGSDDAVNKTV